MNPCIDLTQMEFGNWTVMYKIESDSNGNAVWHCKCKCGKEKDVNGQTLRNGKSKSCGCLRSKMISKRHKKYNDYEIQEDYVIMYTQKGESFYVDLEDFWKVKDICWHKNKDGYIYNSQKGMLHRFIMNCSNEYDIDHKHGKDSRNDNRKSNLRVATRSQNNINKPVRKNNNSGTTGVSWYKKYNKWCSRICINNKQIMLGYFDNKDDAIKARKEAEQKYFGEWSYNNSMI